MTKLYLAHPFTYRHEARKIELKIEKALGIDLLNPFYDTEERKLMEKLDSKQLKLWQARNNVLGHSGIPHNEIVERDLGFCRNLDGLLWLVPYNKYSIGAPMEAFYAHSINKSVYTITYEKNVHHPFVEYVSTEVYISVDGFIKFWNSAQCMTPFFCE